MNLRLLRLWSLNRVRLPSAQLVLLLCLAIRASGILMLAFTIPMVWHHMPHPWWSSLLAMGLAAEGVAVGSWWLSERRPDRRVLWLDLPTGAAAIAVGTWLTDRQGDPGWVLFVYPYTVLLSFVCGTLCRRVVTAACCGALLAAALVASSATFRNVGFAGLVQLALPYLIQPAIGWSCGRMLRRNEEKLATALDEAVRETAELAANAQRWQLARALHDGILQSLETLPRGGDLRDPALREQVADRAVWLRRYIETGREDQSENLAVDLDAIVTVARRAGISVEVNAALLQSSVGGETTLASPQREAMAAALLQTISAFGERSDGVIMVRAVPARGGVSVTVLSTGQTFPGAGNIVDAAARMKAAGGWLSVSAVPCIELWVPGESVPLATFKD